MQIEDQSQRRPARRTPQPRRASSEDPVHAVALTDRRPMGGPRQAPQEPQPAIALPDREPAFHPVQEEEVREGGGKGKGQQPAIQDSPPRRARPPLSIADRAEEPATRRRRQTEGQSALEDAPRRARRRPQAPTPASDAEGQPPASRQRGGGQLAIADRAQSQPPLPRPVAQFTPATPIQIQMPRPPPPPALPEVPLAVEDAPPARDSPREPQRIRQTAFTFVQDYLNELMEQRDWRVLKRFFKIMYEK